MKLFLCCLLVLLVASPGRAQRLEPFNALVHHAPGSATSVAPDTTTHWRYFPLHVGDVWEYEESDGWLQRHVVEKDTTFGGRRYFRLAREVYRPDLTSANGYHLYVRYDTTLRRALQGIAHRPGEEVDFSETPCPFDTDVNTVHECGFATYSVRLAYAGTLVFGEGAGRGHDTVRTSVKSFESLVEYRYAAGIGLVYFEVEGHIKALSYYRVGAVERGLKRIVVGVEAVRPDVALGVRAYPNPARGRAVVRYALPEPGPARIEIADVLGRRVAVLADGPHTAGPHAAALDAAALPPGVYLWRVTTARTTRTGRLVVVR